jgi:hypothetical protein
MSAIKAAVPRNPSLSDVVTALPTVTTDFTNMATAFSTAIADLKSADVGGEIEQAFKQAPSCAAYFSS